MKITLTKEELEAYFRKMIALTPNGLNPAMVKAADKGRVSLRKKSPKDLGIYKGGWAVGVGTNSGRAVASQGRTFNGRKDITSVSLINDSPVAGVIERGARPHNVSLAGRHRIYEWVERNMHPNSKLGSRNKHQNAGNYSNQEIWRIVFAIVHKLKTKGQRARWIVRGELMFLGNTAYTEISKLILQHLRDPKKAP